LLRSSGLTFTAYGEVQWRLKERQRELRANELATKQARIREMEQELAVGAVHVARS
jgi:hypothetical protein